MTSLISKQYSIVFKLLIDHYMITSSFIIILIDICTITSKFSIIFTVFLDIELLARDWTE
jgi:hypothetical protein